MERQETTGSDSSRHVRVPVRVPEWYAFAGGRSAEPNTLSDRAVSIASTILGGEQPERVLFDMPQDKQ
jgi:hypothetical protein